MSKQRASIDEENLDSEDSADNERYFSSWISQHYGRTHRLNLNELTMRIL